MESVAANPDTVVVGHADGTMVEWDRHSWTATAEVHADHSGIFGLAATSKMIASLSLSSLKLWRVGAKRPMFETGTLRDAYWTRFAGDSVIVTDGNYVALRSIRESALTPHELAVLVACKVPDSIREQLGGPPPSATCPEPVSNPK